MSCLRGFTAAEACEVLLYKDVLLIHFIEEY